MNARRSLPVLMPRVPGQCWSCQSCGTCCRTLVIHLTDEDRARLDSQAWSNLDGAAPYVRAGRAWVLNKRNDGACVFLDENNLCRIHAAHGAAGKPLACRIYPFSLRPVQGAWRASLRFDCPSVAASKGNWIKEARPELAELSATLEHTIREEADAARLNRGISATDEEITALVHRLGKWLEDGSFSLTRRLIGVTRVTATLDAADFSKVRGRRFAELLDLLFGALPEEAAATPEPTSERQRAMLRQLVYAHSEHVSLAELRAGPWRRLRMRWRQLRKARRFLAGAGVVPHLPNAPGSVAFSAVESVGSPPEPDAEIADVLLRYLAARLSSRSFCGGGYYGWTVFGGLTALWLSIGVVGWLARYQAALENRTVLGIGDVHSALAIVDAAATRVPALGSSAERIRRVYLSNDDGVARLISHYSVLGEPV